MFTDIVSLVSTHWDIASVIAVSVIIMLAYTGWGMRHRFQGRSIALIWGIYFIIVTAGLCRIASEEKFYHQDWIDRIENATKLMAAAVETLGHVEIKDTGTAYKKIHDITNQWCEDFSSIAGIYTLRRKRGIENKMVWVVDCDVDRNKDGKIDPIHERGHEFGTEYDYWDSCFQAAFEGESVIDEGDRSQSYIRVIVPLRHDRYVEAVFCTEIHKTVWNHIFVHLHHVLFRYISALLGAYLAILGTVMGLTEYFFKLKRSNAALLAAQLQTDRLAKARSNFLAVMSKGIVTPLNAVTSFCDILTQRVGQFCSMELKEEIEGIFDIIRKNGKDLTTIVNDMIDYSKIEANLLQIEMQPIQVRQVLDEVVSSIKPEIAVKNIEFSISIGSLPKFVITDPVRLRQMLVNVVSNAVRLSDRGSISIYCHTRTPTADFAALVDNRLSPEDGNPVIPTAQPCPYPLQTLLQIDVKISHVELTRIQKSIEESAKITESALLRSGEGLGLNVGKQIAQLMDGAILVYSGEPSGSVFSILLNVYIPEDARSVAELVHEFDKSKNLGSQLEPGVEIRDLKTIQEEAIPSKISAQVPFKGIRFLLVEDIVVYQHVLTTLLRSTGAIVDVADNGDSAVKTINSNMDNGICYDVVLMDTQMPVMDGYQAVTQLRHQGYNRPIIAVSAHVLLGDQEKCIEAGYNGCVNKPIDKDELLAAIKEHLR